MSLSPSLSLSVSLCFSISVSLSLYLNSMSHTHSPCGWLLWSWWQARTSTLSAQGRNAWVTTRDGAGLRWGPASWDAA